MEEDGGEIEPLKKGLEAVAIPGASGGINRGWRRWQYQGHPGGSIEDGWVDTRQEWPAFIRLPTECMMVLQAWSSRRGVGLNETVVSGSVRLATEFVSFRPICSYKYF